MISCLVGLALTDSKVESAVIDSLAGRIATSSMAGLGMTTPSSSGDLTTEFPRLLRSMAGLGMTSSLVGLAMTSSSGMSAMTPSMVELTMTRLMVELAMTLLQARPVMTHRQISGLEAKNGSEIAVVTVPETAPASTPKEFATTLFNYWGIGKKDQDNGVLFLISKGDRRVEIETGYGIEGVLPDAQVGQIIEQNILPQFKEGNFNGSILAGTKVLVQVLEGKADASLPNLNTGVSNSSPGFSAETYPSAPDFITSISWYLLLAATVGGIGAAVIALQKRMSRQFLLSRKGVLAQETGTHDDLYTVVTVDSQ